MVSATMGCSTRSVFVLALVLAACMAPPPRVHASLHRSIEMSSASPVDIAVLPIEDATPDRRAEPVLAVVRDEIMAQLVQHMYSPLAITSIDSIAQQDAALASRRVSIADAAWLSTISGRFQEDAILAIRITRWETSSMMVNGRVRFLADVTMVDAKSRRPLIAGSIEGEVKSGGDGPAPLTVEARHEDAGVQLARAIMQQMPSRVR